MDLFADIVKAHQAIRPLVRVTPLDRSPILSERHGCDLYLKCDHLQPTGSFKVRGATNRVLMLDERERRAGITTASTGNHGQAVARAASIVGTQVTVYVSSGAVPDKVDAIRRWGAAIVVVEGNAYDAERQARIAAQDEGKIYVPPYNDHHVMAGQGTLGIELIEQQPDLDAVFLSVGGGGLIGGAGTAIKRLRPEAKIIGCWAENSACMLGALRAGEIVPVDEYPTLSDGTEGAIEPGSITFPACQQVIDDMETVSEAEIASAMRAIADADHWMVEGAAGVALGGFIRQADRWRGRKVAIMLCGRNIATDRYLAAVTQS